MSVRNLDALFKPKAIALIGASNRPRSVGAVVARNLFEAGFQGAVLTVNPHEQVIHSTLNYRTVAELPVTPDLAVLCTPPDTVPGLIAALGAPVFFVHIAMQRDAGQIAGQYAQHFLRDGS